MFQHVCSYCGKPFESPRSNAKYCSRKCYGEDKKGKELNVKHKRSLCVCKQCGKEFWFRDCYIKRGQGKFCSQSCATTYRNIHNNPTKDPKVCEKIAKNHADVNGENNPAYKNGESVRYREKMLKQSQPVCAYCGSLQNVEVHHIDKNHNNNDINNLIYLCRSCHKGKAHKRKNPDYAFLAWIKEQKINRGI